MNDTFTIQTLSSSPRLHVIEGFLDEQEIRHVLQLAEKPERLATGLTTQHDETGFSFEMPVDDDALLRAIRTRIATLVGFDNDHGSTFRFRRYAPGESHPQHTDPYAWHQSELIVTTMMGLVAPERGGETLFPLADGGPVAVRPRPGRLVLWFNHTPDGNVDQQSTHSAALVEAGEKTTVTAFIYKPTHYAASAFPATERKAATRPRLLCVHSARRRAVFDAWMSAAEWVGFDASVWDCRSSDVLPDADVLLPVDFSSVVRRTLVSAYRDGWNNVFRGEPQLAQDARLLLEQRGFVRQPIDPTASAETKLLMDAEVRWLAVAGNECIGPEAPPEASTIAVRAVRELGARTGVVRYNVNESGAVLLVDASAPVELSQLPVEWWSPFCLAVMQGMMARTVQGRALPDQ